MNPQLEQGGRLDLRFLFVLGSVLFVILLVGYFFYGLQPVHLEEVQVVNPVPFKIVQGESFREIAAHLSSQSLIRSIGVFKIYSAFAGRAQKFQPGVYEISAAMSIPQMVDMLTHGGRNEVVVTIPEGTTLKDIDVILKDAGVFEGGTTLVDYPFAKWSQERPYLADARSLEGFLFPDTYRFKINSSADDVIERFLRTFDDKAWPLLEGNGEWYSRLTLASLLEREVPSFNDRQLVAGILLKRIVLDIPLQVDATIGYAKCGGALKNCPGLSVSRSDLSFSSPYNTYQNLGWTPTPISNPGQSAITAALKPQKSSYLYYLSASATKETLFSRTLEEHNLKRVRYL